MGMKYAQVYKILDGKLKGRSYLGDLSVDLKSNNKTNSVALVRKRTIPTEPPPHIGKV
jgi:hypothetical protein